MTTEPAPNNMIKHICQVCGRTINILPSGEKIEDEFCRFCGHEFNWNPWLESVVVNNEAKP